MTILLDVNLLLAFGWKSHPEHRRVRQWVLSLDSFATCPITELGFVRVSMSPGYRSTFEAAREVLAAIKGLGAATFLADTVSVLSLPSVASHRDTTDAYLCRLARANECRLATLDKKLVSADWALGVAFHPFS